MTDQQDGKRTKDDTRSARFTVRGAHIHAPTNTKG
jgi:hypothetical protein